jgi:Kelch motif
MKSLRVALAGIAGAVALAVLVGGASGAGIWTGLAPLPNATEGMSVGTLYGKYIIGAYGFHGGDTTDALVYSTALNAWSFVTSAPAPARSEGAGITVGNFFYSIGGRSGGVGISAVDRYDPATNLWSVMAPMPTARSGLALATDGRYIWAIGGRTGGAPCAPSALDTVERYDTSTNTWTTKASMIVPRSDLAAAFIPGTTKILVAGGCDGSYLTDTNRVDSYDVATNIWSSLPPDLPTARASMYDATAIGNRVYVIGGQSFPGTEVSTNEYFTQGVGWQADTPMPGAMAERGVVTVNGKIYTIGGGLEGSSFNTVQSFGP